MEYKMEYKVLSIWHELPQEIEKTLDYYAGLGWELAAMGDHKLVMKRKKTENPQKQLNG